MILNQSLKSIKINRILPILSNSSTFHTLNRKSYSLTTSLSYSLSSPCFFSKQSSFIPEELLQFTQGRGRHERKDSITLGILQQRKNHQDNYKKKVLLKKFIHALDLEHFGSKKRNNNYYVLSDKDSSGSGSFNDDDFRQALGIGQYYSGGNGKDKETKIGAGGFGEHITSCQRNWPVFDHLLPEIAFAGHSNSGKSTLVNAIVGVLPRHGPAKVSDRAGWTDQVCFFKLGKRPPIVTLADFPGYGHAIASSMDKKMWNNMMKDYLKNRPILTKCCILVDCTRGLCKEDKTTIRYLNKHRIPWVIVLTKCDLLSVSELSQSILTVGESLLPLLPPDHPISIKYHKEKFNIDLTEEFRKTEDEDEFDFFDGEEEEEEEEEEWDKDEEIEEVKEVRAFNEKPVHHIDDTLTNIFGDHKKFKNEIKTSIFKSNKNFNFSFNNYYDDENVNKEGNIKVNDDEEEDEEFFDNIEYIETEENIDELKINNSENENLQEKEFKTNQKVLSIDDMFDDVSDLQHNDEEIEDIEVYIKELEIERKKRALLVSSNLDENVCIEDEDDITYDEVELPQEVNDQDNNEVETIDYYEIPEGMSHNEFFKKKVDELIEEQIALDKQLNQIENVNEENFSSEDDEYDNEEYDVNGEESDETNRDDDFTEDVKLYNVAGEIDYYNINKLIWPISSNTGAGINSLWGAIKKWADHDSTPFINPTSVREHVNANLVRQKNIITRNSVSDLKVKLSKRTLRKLKK